MRMGPKLVPWFGIWLNCAVPAPVSKLFLLMEVLGRVTVKMVDPGVNCGSLDYLWTMDPEMVFAVKSRLSVPVPENSLSCAEGVTEGCRAALTVPVY